MLNYDFYTDIATGESHGNAGLAVVKDSDLSHGVLILNADGSFVYSPDDLQSDNDNDRSTCHTMDGDGNMSADTDGDGVEDNQDICINSASANQYDSNGDCLKQTLLRSAW